MSHSLPRIFRGIHQLLWGLFFCSLFLPGTVQIEESMSFWNGIFSPFSTVFWPYSFFFLSFALFFSGIHFFSSPQKFRRPPPFVLFFWSGILFVSTLSLFLSEFSASGTLFLLWWMLGGMMFFILSVDLFPRRDIVRILIIMGILQSIFALFQTLPSMFAPGNFEIGEYVLRSEAGEILRAQGSLPHPNILGIFLVFVFFLVGFMGRKWKKFQILICLGIVCTFSRSAFLALLFGNILHIATFDKKLKSYFPFFISLVTIVVGLYFRHTFDTFSSSTTVRISEFRGLFAVVKDSWLFGVGVSHYPLALAQSVPLLPWHLQPIHNSFLLIFAETGIGGFLLFSIFYFLWIPKFLKASSGEFRHVLWSLYGVLLVANMFDHFLLTSFWGIILLSLFCDFSFSEEGETK